MREFLRRRQIEESGVTGMSIWAESHAAIHTWDEDNYYAFDAFELQGFPAQGRLRLLLTHFDIEVLNCVRPPALPAHRAAVTSFQINDDWEVLVNGRIVGELEAVNFDELG